MIVSGPIATLDVDQVDAGSMISTPARPCASWMRRWAIARTSRELHAVVDAERERVVVDTCAATVWPAAGARAGRRGGRARPGRCRCCSVSSASSSASPSNTKIAVLTSRIASSSASRRPRLRLDDALDAAVGVADDAAVAGRVLEHHRRHGRGGAALAWAAASAAIASAVTSGTSPASTSTAPPGSICVGRRLDGAAGAVRARAGRRARRRPAVPSSAPSGPPTTTTAPRRPPARRRSASPPSAARRSVKHLRQRERMRVPCPAARITTVGAGMGGC